MAQGEVIARAVVVGTQAQGVLIFLDGLAQKFLLLLGIRAGLLLIDVAPIVERHALYHRIFFKADHGVVFRHSGLHVAFRQIRVAEIEMRPRVFGVRFQGSAVIVGGIVELIVAEGAVALVHEFPLLRLRGGIKGAGGKEQHKENIKKACHCFLKSLKRL